MIGAASDVQRGRRARGGMQGETTEITGLVGWIALAMPLAMLLTAILLTLRRHRPARAAPAATGRYGAPIDDGAAHRAGPAAGARSAAGAAAPRPAADTPPVIVGVEEGELRRRLARAERRGDREAVAALSIALARCCRSQGELREAGDLLRAAIRASTGLADARLHAQARLELGDIAEGNGDLTTACEHWQMARALLDACGARERAAEAEARMSAHGCPTDWVLNDF